MTKKTMRPHCEVHLGTNNSLNLEADELRSIENKLMKSEWAFNYQVGQLTSGKTYKICVVKC